MSYQEPLAYGFNKIIKQYGYFPWYLPLPANLEHGWTPRDHALPTDLKTRKPLMLVMSRRRKAQWKEKSKIPVEVMGSPFIHFKNLHKITQNKDARGTVIFPAHSTYDLKSEYDIKEFCEKLKKLPKKFQSVTICLFYLDFISSKADIYRKLGFKVVTAGCKFGNSLDFVKNFYAILKTHKFSASNQVSSATFYAVDLGLPFFLIGEKPKLDISASCDENIAHMGPGENCQAGEIAEKLFSTGLADRVSPKQKRFVESEMGIGDCLDRNEMNKLLWNYTKQTKIYFLQIIPYLIWIGFKSLLLDAPWTYILVQIKYKISAK